MNNHLILGHNIFQSKTDGLVGAVEKAVELKLKIFQVFLHNPHGLFGKTKKDPVELKKAGELAKKKNIKIVIHASYTLNFCNRPKHYIHQGAIKELARDLNESVPLGAIGVVVHLGKSCAAKEQLDEEEAIKNYVDGIVSSLKKSDKKSTILIETSARQGSEICYRLCALGALYKRIPSKYRSRVGFCLDTCHMFAAGYPMGDPDYMTFFEDYIETHLQWSNVKCIHLNDSKKDVKCCVDSHADIGRGYIDLEGLKEFVKICHRRNVPLVLETPTDYYDDDDNVVDLKKDKTKKKSDYIRYTYDEQETLVKSWINE